MVWFTDSMSLSRLTVTRYLFERGLPEESKQFYELGLLLGQKLKTQLGEAAIESVRESHSLLGITLVETNEHHLSMIHKTKWLSMLEERRTATGYPVEDYELGYAYNEIGVAYGNNNMLNEAADAFRRSIAIFQGLDNYDDTMLGWPEPNLGFIYWMQGKLDNAEQALVEIHDIHAAAYGIDDTESFK
jgi:tetratricopeptide (TPR) repeat protein